MDDRRLSRFLGRGEQLREEIFRDDVGLEKDR
jgi:hypothetical protein